MANNDPNPDTAKGPGQEREVQVKIERGPTPDQFPESAMRSTLHKHEQSGTEEGSGGSNSRPMTHASNEAPQNYHQEKDRLKALGAEREVQLKIARGGTWDYYPESAMRSTLRAQEPSGSEEDNHERGTGGDRDSKDDISNNIKIKRE